MRAQSKISLRYLLLALLLSFPPLAYSSFAPTISNVTLTKEEPQAAPSAITLPYSHPWDNGLRKVRFNMTIAYEPWQSGWVTFVVDDCIREMTVNNMKVNLGGKNTCNWRKGITINLFSYLQSGHNDVTLVAENLMGDLSLNAHASPLGFDHLWVIACYFLLLSGGIFFRVLRTRPDLLVIGIAGLALLMVFLVQRFPAGYTYDIENHRNNIRYYASHLSIPSAEQGEIAHQAPLYYMLAGLTHHLTLTVSNDSDAWFVVTCLNYFFYAMFLLYGIQILRKAIPLKSLQQLGVLALVLWPSGILHATRISNDILLYLSFAGCAYHFIQWRRYHATKQLNIALLWLAVGFATKNSALVLALALLLVSLCHRTPHTALRDMFKYCSRLTCLVLVLTLAAGIGRTAYYAIGNPNTSLLEGKPNQHAQFALNPPELLTFHYSNYLAEPYLRYDPTPTKPSTTPYEQFWGFFLRSLSFGEYSWAGRTQASVANFMLLGMFVCYAFIALTAKQPRRPSRSTDFSLFLGCCMAALIGVKAYFGGFPPWSDARHLHPIVIFFLASYLHDLCRVRRSGNRMFALGVVLLLGYVSAAAVHMYLQMDYSFSGNSPFDFR